MSRFVLYSIRAVIAVMVRTNTEIAALKQDIDNSINVFLVYGEYRVHHQGKLRDVVFKVRI